MPWPQIVQIPVTPRATRQMAITQSCQRVRTEFLLTHAKWQGNGSLLCSPAMRVVLALALVCAGGVAWAKAAPAPKKYYLELTAVEAASNAPAEVTVKAKAIFAQVAATRPQIVTHLDGAPDARAQPEELRRWLDSHGISAFAVRLKLEPFERSLIPDDKPGHSGQILTIKLGVSILGAQIPGEALALAGSGGSTVMAEVGQTLRPREEENALDDALKDALSHALEDAITKLSAPPAKPKPKKHR